MPLTHVFPSTRWSLIQRLDQTLSSAGHLLERYAPAIRAYLGMKYATTHADLVDDLAQEVMVKLWEKPEVLAKAAQNPHRRFRYFLMRVAFNLARNARRSLQHEEEVVCDVSFDADETVEDLDPSELGEMDTAWAMGLLGMALEDCRGWEKEGHLERGSVAMLEANLFEERGVRELATVFNTSRATCARWIAAAKQMLIKSLRDQLVAAAELDRDATNSDAYHILKQAMQAGTQDNKSETPD